MNYCITIKHPQKEDKLEVVTKKLVADTLHNLLKVELKSADCKDEVLQEVVDKKDLLTTRKEFRTSTRNFIFEKYNKTIYLQVGDLLINIEPTDVMISKKDFLVIHEDPTNYNLTTNIFQAKRKLTKYLYMVLDQSEEVTADIPKLLEVVMKDLPWSELDLRGSTHRIYSNGDYVYVQDYANGKNLTIRKIKTKVTDMTCKEELLEGGLN